MAVLDACHLLSGRRVLVIGAGGFLGGHLVGRLIECGAVVHAAARRVAPPDARAHWHVVDVRDVSSLKAAVAASQPDVVFHLAAHGTTAPDADPDTSRAVNVGGVEHLWSALEGSTARLVQTGTPAEYGPALGALNEEADCRPQSAYARTVHEGVVLSRRRARVTGREVVIVRPFGSYGPNDRPERLIPHTILTLLAGGSVELTRGEQRRDFSFVSDHIDGFLLAATARLADTGREFNLGSGGPIRVRTVVETIAAVMDVSSDRLRFGAIPDRPSDAYDMFADTTRARSELGWVPRIPLGEGLAMTAAAYRSQQPRGRAD